MSAVPIFPPQGTLAGAALNFSSGGMQEKMKTENRYFLGGLRPLRIKNPCQLDDSTLDFV